MSVTLTCPKPNESGSRSLAQALKNEAGGLSMTLFGGLMCLTKDFSVTAVPRIDIRLFRWHLR
jgi:hypothetical protein